MCDLQPGNVEPDPAGGGAAVSGQAINVLAPGVLLHCGELLHDLFRRYVAAKRDFGCLPRQKTRERTCDDGSDCEDRCNRSGCATTVMDEMLRKRFDLVYDLLSHRLEPHVGPDRYRQQSGWSPRRLREDLTAFAVHDCRLHRINRYVFGGARSTGRNWGPTAQAALTAVRTWRKTFADNRGVPDGLIVAYEQAACASLHPYETALVAFAVFAFLLGYNSSNGVDVTITHSFREIKAFEQPPNFQQVYNASVRHARKFMYKIRTCNEERAARLFERYFGSCSENHKQVTALLRWAFNKTVACDHGSYPWSSNPFCLNAVDVHLDHPCGNRLPIAPSQLIRLRMCYRWLSQVVGQLLSGKSCDRLSRLDDHVQICMGSLTKLCASPLYDEAYNLVWKHFESIFQEHRCPENEMETFYKFWDDNTFKGFVKTVILEFARDLLDFQCFDNSSVSSQETSSAELSTSTE